MSTEEGGKVTFQIDREDAEWIAEGLDSGRNAAFWRAIDRVCESIEAALEAPPQSPGVSEGMASFVRGYLAECDFDMEGLPTTRQIRIAILRASLQVAADSSPPIDDDHPVLLEVREAVCGELDAFGYRDEEGEPLFADGCETIANAISDRVKPLLRAALLEEAQPSPEPSELDKLVEIVTHPAEAFAALPEAERKRYEDARRSIVEARDARPGGEVIGSAEELSEAEPLEGEGERSAAQCHGCKRDFEAEGHETLPIDWSAPIIDGKCVLQCPDYPDCATQSDPQPSVEQGVVEDYEQFQVIVTEPTRDGDRTLDYGPFKDLQRARDLAEEEGSRGPRVRVQVERRRTTHTAWEPATKGAS